MDKKTAEMIVTLSTSCTRDTNASVQKVMEQCDEATFKSYRKYAGKMMGYLFTEIIAPIQTEYPELAPPEFEAMESVELPQWTLTKDLRDELLETLEHWHVQLGGMAQMIHENSTPLETAIYRSRIHQVLMHVSAALACVIAARVVPEANRESAPPGDAA